MRPKPVQKEPFMEDRLARQLAWLGINKDTYARSNAGTYKWIYDVDYVG